VTRTELAALADRAVAKAKLKHEMRVLDPYFSGEIALAAAKVAAVRFDGLALDESVEARMLMVRPTVVGAGGTLMARRQDILSIEPEKLYDAVITNATDRTSLDYRTESEVLSHASKFVRAGGVMVAILTNKAELDVAMWALLKAGEVEQVGLEHIMLTVRQIR